MRPKFIIIAVLAVNLAAGCSDPNSNKKIPSPFEIIGQSTVSSARIYAVRDKGTGCEFIFTEKGAMIPRYERSADGTSVKQRCVMTGEEETPAGGAPVIMEMKEAGAVPVNPVGPEAQEQALRDAIRAETEAAAKRNSIPPPTAPGNATSVPKREDGIESQLK